MTILRVDDVSIAFTSFFMKLIGFWLAANRSEQRLRDVTLFYTMFAILFSLWVQTTDFYHSREDFGACLYNACNILSLTVPMFKILVLLVHKKKFFHLITYLERNFLHANYDKYETSVLASCKRKCTFFICFFIFLTEGTVFSYIITPVIVNIGRNESDRTLPFNMWVNLPLSITPYYEITFVIQVLCVYHIGLTYFCFDNFLCIMNLHLAGQFQILQYRVSNKCVIKDQEKSNLKLEKNSLKFINDCCATFKSYIRQHQILIAYCDQIEEIFNLIVLVQVITFSLLICLDGYQILVADVPHRKIIFFFHLMGTVCQLLMFTYSCDCVIQESRKLARAVYSGPWLLLPMNENVQKLRKDLVMVIMRSHKPCCLTACKFFMVSLETYTKVLTTAASYFTLLQQSEDVNSS
nr:odorant receptor 13a-like [Osmia lignaria]